MLKWVHHSPPPTNHMTVTSHGETTTTTTTSDEHEIVDSEKNKTERNKANEGKEQKEKNVDTSSRRRFGVRNNLPGLAEVSCQYNFLSFITIAEELLFFFFFLYLTI